ncbi:MAG: hypothetical protein WBG29_10130, partial [Candidatus Acidiferrales bacterium]
MTLLEQKIRRYEHKRWAAEPNRRTLPFAWGLEHIGGCENEADPRAFLRRFVEQTLVGSPAWFACETPGDYELTAESDGVAWKGALEFT